MVEKNQQNQSWARSLNSLVIKFFNDNFPSFILTNETEHGPYWGVQFAKDNVEIHIGGDIGFHIDILIDGKSFPLWQYDKSVNNAMETTERNVLHQLNVTKRFLSETSV